MVSADRQSFCKYYRGTDVIECQCLLIVETRNNTLILLLAFLIKQAGKHLLSPSQSIPPYPVIHLIIFRKATCVV